MDAALVMIGEQPGDQEDRAGRPFVGPAGRVLDQALRTVQVLGLGSGLSVRVCRSALRLRVEAVNAEERRLSHSYVGRRVFG